MKYLVKRLGGLWQITDRTRDEMPAMKRGDYPICIRYVVVDTDYPEYPLCFTDSAVHAQNIANALNHCR